MSPDATQLTELLRCGNEGLWTQLRTLLAEKGLDFQKIALAQSFEDGAHQEFGIVVSPDLRVYEFILEYQAEDKHHTAEGAYLREWNEQSDSWRDRPFHEEVRAAMEWLASD